MSEKAKIFAFCNQKGGVGKTTSAINIAAGLALKGQSVLLIDIDPQGNTTSGLGIDKSKELVTIYNALFSEATLVSTIRKTDIAGLDIIPSNSDLSGAEIELVPLMAREFRLKNLLASLDPKYKYIFIDCPPSLGLLSINALSASDFLLIPLQCEYYALEGLAQLLEIFSLIKKNLNPSLQIGGVLLTMADFRAKLTDQVINDVRNYFKDKVFTSIIPRSVKLSEAPSFGKPGILYDKFSRGSKSYLEAVDEFLKRFGTNKNESKTPQLETKQEKAMEAQT